MQSIDITKDSAIFSPCMKYRYILTRRFDPDNSTVCNFIMLNPSTATAEKNDPTVARCCKYAKRWGYGALIVTNIFAYRATDPKDMKAQNDPFGQDNAYWLRMAAEISDFRVCAWGTNGTYRKQNKAVLWLMKRNPSQGLYCLEITKHGHPKHPLYCKCDLKPIPYERAANL